METKRVIRRLLVRLPQECALLLLLSGPVMYEQVLEETAVLPAVRRECQCHKINVGAAQEQLEITWKMQQEEPFSLVIMHLILLLPHMLNISNSLSV